MVYTVEDAFYGIPLCIGANVSDGQSNGHVSHAKSHAKSHVKSHANSHVKSHANDHANGHSNGHAHVSYTVSDRKDDNPPGKIYSDGIKLVIALPINNTWVELFDVENCNHCGYWPLSEISRHSNLTQQHAKTLASMIKRKKSIEEIPYNLLRPDEQQYVDLADPDGEIRRKIKLRNFKKRIREIVY